MFVVLLTFADKSQAGKLMDDHNAWIQQGLTDKVFLVVGSLQPGRGGAIVATNTDRDALQERLNLDPFVIHGVVKTEIMEISPNQVDERLSFLLP